MTYFRIKEKHLCQNNKYRVWRLTLINKYESVLLIGSYIPDENWKYDEKYDGKQKQNYINDINKA